MPKSYRIRTEVGVDKYINVNLEQDWESLEVLSLKILSNDIYSRFCANYGVVVGRVFVNGGFGLPNAKVSIFIPLNEEDELNPVISELYPYKTITDTNEEGYRYNLLPKTPSYNGHKSTGSFPNVGDVIMDQSFIEVYDKYYRLTVTTNESGDFMIFGVPVGNQTIVMDVDLSDIGCFSLSPQDLIRQGLATETQVDGATFKTSTNLRELPQIQNLVFDVDVRPFWGDDDLCQVGITRVDFDLTKQANINIQPSAIFMGSIISTTNDDSLKVSCKPKNNTGNLCELITGPGEILAIRQTINTDSSGLPILEEYVLDDGGKVIDENGTYLVNVPMNLDYVYTNEFGQQVISNDPNKGIPTKGKYRFKFKWQNPEGLQSSFLRANFLVPNVKEYGWTNNNDPLDVEIPQFLYNLNTGVITGNTQVFNTIRILNNPILTNVDSYSVYINNNLYVGDLNSIVLNAGDSFFIVSFPIDPNQPQVIEYTSFPENYSKLIKSYSFSLDWNDYVNTQEAINCEDTFYEFNYNKVYTTGLFLDRYKNGVGRAKHLGIKEIDNRSCKSNVNTFPVNDIIRNFDFIFFVFNIFINILTFPLIALLFIMHVVAVIWEVIRRIINGIRRIFRINRPPVPPFPRIGLPMISYPDCTSCECSCGSNSDDGDNISQSPPLIEYDNGEESLPYSGTLSKVNTNIAPVSSPNLYNIDHPNIMSLADGTGPFDCGSGFGGNFKSFESLINGFNLSSGVALQASLDFKRVISGYDVITSTNQNKLFPDEKYLLKAPQPFLWAADNSSNPNNPDKRYFAYPKSDTYPQKLNEFNTRDKYFNGVNKIKTTVNPTLGSTPFNDQVVVILMNTGTKDEIGVGNLCMFQDPNYQQTGSNVDRLVNISGLTTNQFNNKAVTGETIVGQTSIVVNYADPNDPNGQNNLQSVVILNTQLNGDQLPTNNPNIVQDYLKYPTDIEYFQLITGITVSDFITQSDNNPGSFKDSYLLHNIDISVPNCDAITLNNGFDTYTISEVLTLLPNYENFEICIFTRGVDPHTDKQNIRYDLSTIFGYSSEDNVVIEGDYYLNIPIQGFVNGVKPRSHSTATNNDGLLYFPSYTFTITDSNYTAFVSDLPYYYLSTDDNISVNYNPAPFLNWQTAGDLTTPNGVLINSNYTLPQNDSDYVGGGSFVGWSDDLQYEALLYTDSTDSGNLTCPQICKITQYYAKLQNSNNFGSTSAGGKLSVLYSSAYYRYGLTPIFFTNSNGIVMRSDRIPTSTNVENGANNRTGFGLHQNNNFVIYSSEGIVSPVNVNVGGDIFNGESFDQDDITGNLTSTLTCEGMVPLSCYSGSGSNVGVIPSDQCSVPSDRMKNGCYCLVNKLYIIEYLRDVKLFLEWKVRFTMNFAACRGVFGQVFQNNWINGVLYMFSFNKRSVFGFNPNNPDYRYCDDVIMYNKVSNNFYYRSSPWNSNNQKFIGKPSPQVGSLISSIVNVGYNQKQIQFPTTIVDLGPRDSYINEICCNGIDGFGAYFSDQIVPTSYQDNADIIQLGFLSRILNQGVRQRIIPISVGGNNSEGQGIIQFFNSDRGGQRIDGDWAQMLSINSEWKVLPFISENVPSSEYIYFGDNGASGNNIQPIMGLFFQTPLVNLSYRKNMAPGVETYSFNPLIEENYGYPNSQEVPFYKWWVKTPSNQNGVPNIFGSEDNNWFTNTSAGGFYSKKYQDLNFNSINEKYQTNLSKFGYITSYDINGNPLPVTPLNSIMQGAPSNNSNTSVIVGAPYHFYFGLNNGKTAVDRFYKLYVRSED